MGGKVNRLTYSLMFLSIWGFLAACSQPQQINTAPKNEEEASARFIIKGSQADTQAVISASQSYRVLSAKHNIYEVQGLDYQQIKSVAPKVSAERNQYIKLQMMDVEENPLAAFIDSSSPQEPKTPNKNIVSKMVPPILEGCDMQATVKPDAKLTVINDVLQTSPTMNLGEKVVFSDDGSTANPATTDSTLTYRWTVYAPSGSETINGVVTEAKTFELTTDMVGMYQAVFVVQDADKACAVQPVKFLVTYNPDFNFPQVGDEMPQVKNLDAFTHLKRIQTQEAWDLASGKNIKIAILDTGVNYNHPAIKFNLAINELEQNGTPDSDDDGNEYKDDILGWDFVNNDNKPFDDQGHGSHVAGLAASSVHGIAHQAKVLPVKVLSASGGGDVATVIAGVYYAVDSGVDIINSSLGGSKSKVQLFKEALQYAEDKGVVFVSASGNSSLDLDQPGNDVYPGELDVANVVNVDAVGIDQNLASYSNYGKVETDVAAPGGDKGEPLYSLATYNPKGVTFIGMGGTSMASPVVAGVAALMLDANPQLKPEQIRKVLMESGTSYTELSDVVGSGKIVSALEAVKNAVQFRQDKTILAF